jgi:hypothetical protein
VFSSTPPARAIEDPCSKLQGIFNRTECGLFYDSLAFAVQIETAAGLSGPAAVSENTKAGGRFDPPSAFPVLTGVVSLSAPQADRYDSNTGN